MLHTLESRAERSGVSYRSARRTRIGGASTWRRSPATSPQPAQIRRLGGRPALEIRLVSSFDVPFMSGLLSSLLFPSTSRIVAIDACVYPGGCVSPPKRAPLVMVLVVSSPPTNGAGRPFRTSWQRTGNRPASGNRHEGKAFATAAESHPSELDLRVEVLSGAILRRSEAGSQLRRLARRFAVDDLPVLGPGRTLQNVKKRSASAVKGSKPVLAAAHQPSTGSCCSRMLRRT